MTGLTLSFCGTELTALPSGALWWAAERLLVVSDLHLGKSERLARRGGTLLPPYETRETLSRLEADIGTTDPASVICLGDSFDDSAAADALEEEATLWITRLMAGRRWIWIEGNHDPGPVTLGGSHLQSLRQGPLLFRHIAEPGAKGEISGHYHPKFTLSARGQRISRPCFMVDSRRMILPAYGRYTGGLSCSAPALASLFGAEGRAVLLGPSPVAVPLSRRDDRSSASTSC